MRLAVRQGHIVLDGLRMMICWKRTTVTCSRVPVKLQRTAVNLEKQHNQLENNGF